METSKYYTKEMEIIKKDIEYRKRDIDGLASRAANVCGKYNIGDIKEYGLIARSDRYDKIKRYCDHDYVSCLIEYIEKYEREIEDMLDELEGAKENKLLAECDYCLFSETNPCKVYTNRRIIVLCD